jgi:hypothetical protein
VAQYGHSNRLDQPSIVVMEIVDSLIMLVITGAMNAGLASVLFWITLPVSLIVAGPAAFPVNLWLIARGQGHALVHEHHHPGHPPVPDVAESLLASDFSPPIWVRSSVG